jgi:hypothetical protein
MKCFTAHTFALPLFPLYRRNVVFIELYTSSTFCTPDWLLFSFKASATRGKATEKPSRIDTFMALEPGFGALFHKLIYPQRCKFQRKDLLLSP